MARGGQGDHERYGKSTATGSGPGTGGRAGRGNKSAELTTDEWLDIWAFGISPWGLALSEYRLWTLTPREFTSLKYVWASNQALLHNAHFRGAGDLAWIPEDFMSATSRLERQAQATRDKIELATLNQRLSNMKKGDTEGVPEMFLEAN